MLHLAYTVTTWTSFVAWLLVLAYVTPAVARVILGASTRRDLIGVNTATIASVFVLGFATRLLFWAPAVVTREEVVARTFIGLMATAAALGSLAFHHQADRRQEY